MNITGRMRAVLTISCVVIAILGLTAQVRTGTLTIYYIDTEGGQSTLFVGPTGESLLVDTGNAGDRDLGRIAETLRTPASRKSITCGRPTYHGDHVGALVELAKQFPWGISTITASRTRTTASCLPSSSPPTNH
jgi:glyoxylase-like metal-dependent hydrolase (beta-lactamase superfamily II)